MATCVLVASLLLPAGAAGAAGGAGAAGAAGAAGQPRLDPAAGWLTAVNWYRAGSGLPPVTENSNWEAGIAAHLQYLKLTPAGYRTGQYASAHTENPASPYYTAAGDSEAQSSDLAFGSSGERSAIDGWMAAPFHAIGILRPGLQQAAFARDAGTGYAGLDVIHGLAGTGPPTTPVLFPGPGAPVHLAAFAAESPSPLETCGYPSAGLPLVALLPRTPVAGTTADLVDDAGAGQEVCAVTEHNYTSGDPVYGPTGKLILQIDRAVLVIPRKPLRPTRYTARIHQPGLPDVTWSFYVTGLAGTAIGGDGIMRIHVTETPGATVLGNLTVTDPAGPGYTTAYPCAEGRPLASTNNYGPGQTIPNFAVVRSDQAGDVCVYTLATADLIWDQVGQTTAFTTTNAIRLVDTRNTAKVAAGGTLRIHASDTAGATVMGNLTVTEPGGPGFTTAYPCAEGRPLASTNNYGPGQTIANFAVVRADQAGDMCVYTQAGTHLIWDQVGQTTAFATANASRLLDTRNTAKVAPGGTVRIHVSDTAGATVMGNLTVTDPNGPGFTTAYPCAAGRPLASNNNYEAGQTIPNFAVVRADQAGDMCVYTQAGTNLIWDQVGQTTAFTATDAVRLFDSRRD